MCRTLFILGFGLLETKETAWLFFGPFIPADPLEDVQMRPGELKLDADVLCMQTGLLSRGRLH